jgi:L-threonylcarbamoyladenylate synthase
VTAHTPTPQALAQAAGVLRAGGLVAFPTETVYGLGADARSASAVEGVFALKGRPAANPLIIHVLGAVEARALVDWTPEAAALARRFWSGALTLVLPKAPDCPVARAACAGLPTLAVRAPAHPVARALLRAFGGPIAAPSANRSGAPSPTTAQHVLDDLGPDAPLTLAAGRSTIGLESTVLDLSQGQPAILRAGAVTAQHIAECLGAEAIPMADTRAGAPRSPGLAHRHYTPRIPVRLRAYEVRPGEALLAFGSTRFMNAGAAAAVANLSEAGDLDEAAANLFAHMRALDRPAHAGIAVMDIPQVGIGVAINDRLARAAE